MQQTRTKEEKQETDTAVQAKRHVGKGIRRGVQP